MTYLADKDATQAISSIQAYFAQQKHALIHQAVRDLHRDLPKEPLVPITVDKLMEMPQILVLKQQWEKEDKRHATFIEAIKGHEEQFAAYQAAVQNVMKLKKHLDIVDDFKRRTPDLSEPARRRLGFDHIEVDEAFKAMKQAGDTLFDTLKDHKDKQLAPLMLDIAWNQAYQATLEKHNPLLLADPRLEDFSLLSRINLEKARISQPSFETIKSHPDLQPLMQKANGVYNKYIKNKTITNHNEAIAVTTEVENFFTAPGGENRAVRGKILKDAGIDPADIAHQTLQTIGKTLTEEAMRHTEREVKEKQKPVSQPQSHLTPAQEKRLAAVLQNVIATPLEKAAHASGLPDNAMAQAKIAIKRL